LHNKKDEKRYTYEVSDPEISGLTIAASLLGQKNIIYLMDNLASFFPLRGR
jgi:hypothetical protein